MHAAVTVTWCAPAELMPTMSRRLEPARVVLDIGCGIVPQPYVRPLVHICCEPYEGYVRVLQERARDAVDRSYVVLQAGWADAVRLFPPGSVDTVFLVDVIEHLEKEEGRRLLAQTEALARRQVVVFTPLGFVPQHHPDGKDAWGLDGGAWQEHKSGWEPEDFGPSWEVFAAREFHTRDNLGRPLVPPAGALWAVKTGPGPSMSRLRVRALTELGRTLGRLHRLLGRAPRPRERT